MEKFRLLLVVFCLFCAACSDDDEPVVLEVDKTSVELSGDGGSEELAVTCNGEWTAESSSDWCKVAAGEGRLTISAEENTTEEEQVAIVTVTCREVQVMISVKQGLPVPGANELFAGSDLKWGFDLTSFKGKMKELYDASVTAFVNKSMMGPGSKGYVLQSLVVDNGKLRFVLHDEDMKGFGAPEDMWLYKGTLLISVEVVDGTKDQLKFKDIKVDPAASESDYGDYWYENKDWRCEEFRVFINALMEQSFTIVPLEGEGNVLQFNGVTEKESGFRLAEVVG